MADTHDDCEENDENDDVESIEEVAKVGKGVKSQPKAEEPFNFAKPKKLVYCPTCTLPPEFCEYGQSFDKCLPWILENCPEAVSPDVLATLLGDASIADGEEVICSIDSVAVNFKHSQGNLQLTSPLINFSLSGRREKKEQARRRCWPQKGKSSSRDKDCYSENTETKKKVCDCRRWIRYRS